MKNFIEERSAFGIQPLTMIIQNDYISKIEELKGQKIIGLETNQWLYLKEDLDLFIKGGTELIDDINSMIL